MVLYENLENEAVTRFNAAYYKEVQESAFAALHGANPKFKFGADVNRLIVAALVCDRREAIVGPA